MVEDTCGVMQVEETDAILSGHVRMSDAYRILAGPVGVVVERWAWMEALAWGASDDVCGHAGFESFHRVRPK